MKFYTIKKQAVALIPCLVFLLSPVLASANTADDTPDLPLIESNALIEADIDAIVDVYADIFLGTTAPSANALSNAIAQYNSLNIAVNNGNISGNTLSSYRDVPFLKTFIQHLRFNPDDAEVRNRAMNIVWLVGRQIKDGDIAVDSQGYSFRDFIRPAVFLNKFLNEEIAALLKNAMTVHGTLEHFWAPVYDEAYQAANGAINTDIMFNQGDALMVYSANQPDANERYRWMRGFQRWVERYGSYTFGTADGIKIDGVGFHHWTAYDDYMYSFQTACDVVYYLTDTEFQINEESYLVLRKAIYTQIILGNESGTKALSMAGRNPGSRSISYSSSSIKRLALAGGKILGLSTADPLLAGEYNRIWGYTPDFNYPTITPLEQSAGFFQFNYGTAGIFRKDSWLAVMKGFTDGLWGSELYSTQNRYGRYQSYGSLELIYHGGLETGNGYDVETWNWNYNPGATTIVLPWIKLHGERARIDELQQKGFAGSLAFKNKDNEVLPQTHGAAGVFAMDFQEQEGLGWGTVFSGNTHNATFRFKKSTFAFDDIIVCLGSDINNDDTENPTVTTLFQRLSNTPQPLWANGRTQRRNTTFDGTSDNWLWSNYKTGFYIVSGNNNTTVWKGEQQTPNENQTDPTAYTGNKKDTYWLGYLDHGINPVDASYEYMVFPNTTKEILETYDSEIKGGNKPYSVHQKNSDAHILEHNSGVWGYAVFQENLSFDNNGLVAHASHPCLMMYEEGLDKNTAKLALSNPSLGVISRSYVAADELAIQITLKGRWILSDNENPNVQVAHNGESTELTFSTKDGLPIEIDLIKDGQSSVADNMDGKDSIRIHPNPADKQFSLHGLFSENSTWELFNSSGAKLGEGPILNEETIVDVSQYPTGVYFVRTMHNNKALFSSKVIVNR